MTGEERNARAQRVDGVLAERLRSRDEPVRVLAWRTSQIMRACPQVTWRDAELLAAGGDDLQAIVGALVHGCSPTIALLIFT